MLPEQNTALPHTAWAARSALQTVTGRIVIPDIFISSVNNTSSKWLKRPAVTDVALTGPRHNLTLRHAALPAVGLRVRALRRGQHSQTGPFVQQNVITCP